jgi:DNA-binding MarR family transcriptional regulator
MDNMSENIATLMYETNLRARLFRTSNGAENDVVALTQRERLLVEIIGMRDNMSISEISQLCPTVGNSTISTIITRLWKDKKLVEKKILPENQRITNVSLTAEGRRVLNSIKVWESEVYKRIGESLGLSPEQDEYFKAVIEIAIIFFNHKLGFQMERAETVYPNRAKNAQLVANPSEG